MPGEGSSFDVPPAVFGRYRVLHQIGAGNLGPVFYGEDSDSRRPVAIKILKLALNPQRANAVAAGLDALGLHIPDHPSLTRILDAGLTENGEPFVVSAFVDGDPLDSALREYGPAAILDALPRLEAIASALDAVADAGFCHGGLQPRDIIVSPDDTTLTAVGIAPLVQEEINRLPPVRPYTAPEVEAGRDCSPRADQFALAAIAYELLFGRRIPGPSYSAITVPELPRVDAGKLSSAFTVALAPEPGDRFTSCSAFVRALGVAAGQIRRREIVSPAPAPPVRSGEPAEPAAASARRGPPPAPRETNVSLTAAPIRFDDVAAAPPQTPLDDLHLHEFETPVEARLPALGWSIDETPAREPDMSSLDVGDMLTDAPPRPRDSAPVFWQGTLGQTPDEAPAAGRANRGTLAATLLIGLAIGAIGGYAFGRSRGNGNGPMANLPPAASAAPATNTTSAQSFTEAPLPATVGAADPANPTAPDPLNATPPVPANVSAPTIPATTPPAEASLEAERELAVGPGRLLVRSTPEGAAVVVDGIHRGNTPLVLRDLALGTHVVMLKSSGYTSIERRITLTPDRPSRSLEETLAVVPQDVARAAARAPAAATTGTLLIDSRPSGALVSVDGRPVGTTPLSVPAVSPGRHTIRIERSGYQPWTTTVEIAGGERARVAASLAGGTSQE